MIITVAHTKGGVGKSLLAWNLAIQMRAKKVLDLDFQKTLTFVNFLRVQNGIKEMNVVKISDRDELMEELDGSQPSDIVIIDVGGYDSTLTRSAVFVADFVLTPASDRITEAAGLMEFENIIMEVSENTDNLIKANIVINNVNPNAKNFEMLHQFANSKDNFELMETIIYQRADYYKSMELGQGVCEMTKNGKAKREIERLIKEIKKKVIENG